MNNVNNNILENILNENKTKEKTNKYEIIGKYLIINKKYFLITDIKINKEGKEELILLDINFGLKDKKEFNKDFEITEKIPEEEKNKIFKNSSSFKNILDSNSNNKSEDPLNSFKSLKFDSLLKEDKNNELQKINFYLISLILSSDSTVNNKLKALLMNPEKNLNNNNKQNNKTQITTFLLYKLIELNIFSFENNKIKINENLLETFIKNNFIEKLDKKENLEDFKNEKQNIKNILNNKNLDISSTLKNFLENPSELLKNSNKYNKDKNKDFNEEFNKKFFNYLINSGAITIKNGKLEINFSMIQEILKNIEKQLIKENLIKKNSNPLNNKGKTINREGVELEIMKVEKVGGEFIYTCYDFKNKRVNLIEDSKNLEIKEKKSRIAFFNNTSESNNSAKDKELFIFGKELKSSENAFLLYFRENKIPMELKKEIDKKKLLKPIFDKLVELKILSKDSEKEMIVIDNFKALEIIISIINNQLELEKTVNKTNNKKYEKEEENSFTPSYNLTMNQQKK